MDKKSLSFITKIFCYNNNITFDFIYLFSDRLGNYRNKIFEK